MPKKSKKAPYLNIPLSWWKLVREYERDGETRNINHAMVILLSLIHSLSHNDRNGCYATDEYLANILNVEECTIQKYVKQLKFADLVKYFNVKEKVTHRTLYVQYENVKKYIKQKGKTTIHVDTHGDDDHTAMDNTDVSAINKGLLKEPDTSTQRSEGEAAQTSQSEDKPKKKQRKRNPYTPSNWTPEVFASVAEAIKSTTEHLKLSNEKLPF